MDASPAEDKPYIVIPTDLIVPQPQYFVDV